MNKIGTIRGVRSFRFLIWLGLMMLAGILVQDRCRAEGKKLSEEDRKVLQQVGNFHEVKAVTNLPPSIVAICVGGSGKLAERGGQWNATDVIRDESVPTHRLIWAVKGGNYYVVHYETGGRAHMYHVLVAQISNDVAKPRVALNGGWFKKFKNYEEFVASLGVNEQSKSK